MADPRTDAIAREAARLMVLGRVTGIAEAVRQAAETLGYQDVDRPGTGRVRQHVRARSMQVMGEAGYAESVRDVWRTAERLMTLLVETMPEADVLLVGRAARGQIDGGVRVHLRLYSDLPIGEIAGRLVGFGYDEPAIQTVNTRHGRLNRLVLEDDGLELVLTRCPFPTSDDAGVDLITGRPIRTATLTQLRRLLGENDGDDGAAPERYP